jgi:ribosomal protein S17
MMKTVSVAVQRIFRDNHLQRTVRDTKKYLVRLPQTHACDESPLLTAGY